MTDVNVAAKTIQIFLPSGDPRGIRVAEITTRIVRVIEVPRSLVTEFLAMPEAKQVGIYFLVGDTGDEENPQLYIGQSGVTLLLFKGLVHVRPPAFAQLFERADINIAIVKKAFQQRHFVHQKAPVLSNAVATQRGFALGHVLA